MVIRITPGNKDEINLPSKIDDDRVVLDGLTDYTIDGVEFSYDEDEGDGMLLLKNCVNCTISNCTFRDKSTKGNFITILGQRSNGNVIDHCEFRKHTFSGSNEGEAIRIGGSEFSGCSFNTTIQYCWFHDLEGREPESISIKSCHNILQNNRHEKCKSSFTIRHGGFNTIKDNVFIGSGGIRVYGDDNQITGNLHIDNNNRDKSPLAIVNGNIEDDINFGKECKDGCSHAVYARSKNNVIQHNVYYNCKGTCIRWGYKNYNEVEVCNDEKLQINEHFPPTRNMLINNMIVVDDGHEDSILVEFSDDITPEVARNDNLFEYNKYYNAKLGEIPHRPDEDKLTTKPEIQVPDVWPSVKLEEVIS